MMKQKPYYLLFFLAFILAALSFFQSNGTMPINFKDTYYVIGYRQFYMLLALFLAVVFLVYQLLEKIKVMLQNNITLLHVYATLLSVIAVLYFTYKNAQPDGVQVLTTSDNYNSSLIIALVIVSLVQLFLIMNIFVGIVRKMLLKRNR